MCLISLFFIEIFSYDKMSCNKSECCQSNSTVSVNKSSCSTNPLKSAKQKRQAQKINKQKNATNICSKCENPVDVRVGTNGRYCAACFINYCCDKMRKAMSKSTGVDLRKEERSVLVTKPSEKRSLSSVALLLLFNEIQKSNKPFKCFIDKIICCVDSDENNNNEVKDEKLENLKNLLVNLKDIEISYVANQQFATSRISANKNLIQYVAKLDPKINYVITGFTTTTIAGNILKDITDGAGEHISIDSSGLELVKSGVKDDQDQLAFIKPFRDLSKTDLKNVIRIFAENKVKNQPENLQNCLENQQLVNPLDNQNKFRSPVNCSTSLVLARELKKFLYDLDDEYPAQIFAVYRIGNKLIGDHKSKDPEFRDKSCQVCLRHINYEYESTAMVQMDFCQKFDTDINFSFDQLMSLEDSDSSLGFRNQGKYLNDDVCYNCSRLQ